MYFSNIEGHPHELQYDVWEEHAPEFYSKEDPSKFSELFLNFVVKYNFIHEDEIMMMFTLSIRRHLGYWYYDLPSKRISSFYNFINVFFESVMGDMFIEIHETSIWFTICQVND